MSDPTGTLYVVSTPIGNLEDITYRAVRVLREVERIAAEHTRHTRVLLQRYDIHTPLTSYHDHNARERASELVERLGKGENIALVSDAGTPGIADPGYILIHRAIEAGFRVVPVPGVVAGIAAASVSGLPLHEFFYAGFCSPKAGRRRRRLESLRSLPSTLIFYESPHRIEHFLRDAEEVFGARPAVVTRELTKVHEEVLRGTLPELRAHFEAHPPRGEITVLIGGCDRESKARP